MKCPNCKKEIAGYVQMGTVAYQRVSRGCCPHCGVSLPGGYRIGVTSSGKSKITKEEFELSRTGFDQRAISILIAIFVSLWSLWTDGRMVIGTGAIIVILSIADILYGGIVFLYSAVIGWPKSMIAYMFEGLINKKEQASAAMGGLKLLFDFCLVLVMLTVRLETGDIMLPSIRMGIILLLAVWYGSAPMLAKRRRKNR